MDWRGFELHPDTPPGGMPISDLFAAARLGEMKKYMENFAAGFGITNMRQPDRIPNTKRAIAAAEYARDKGALTEFKTAAMNAYWRDGVDLESDEGIAEIARRAGIDPGSAVAASTSPKYRERVMEMIQEAVENGVTGIPTFLFGDLRVVGCQHYDVLADAAVRTGAPKRGR